MSEESHFAFFHSSIRTTLSQNTHYRNFWYDNQSPSIQYIQVFIHYFYTGCKWKIFRTYKYIISLSFVFLYDHDRNSTKHIRVTYHRRSTIMISLEENRKGDTPLRLLFICLSPWRVLKPKSLFYFKLHICPVVCVSWLYSPRSFFLTETWEQHRETCTILFSLVRGGTQSRDSSLVIHLLARQSVCYANPVRPVLT